jgi:formyltetrahydrofolate hydrolase
MDNSHEAATKQDLSDVRQVLKQDIAAVKQELKQDLAGVRQELKQDLADARQELKQDIAILRSEMNHQFDDLKETFRDSQTELLKAFYSFTESNRHRVGQVETSQAALITRVGVLEDRMLELERKVNFPNHPTQ